MNVHQDTHKISLLGAKVFSLYNSGTVNLLIFVHTSQFQFTFAKIFKIKFFVSDKKDQEYCKTLPVYKSGLKFSVGILVN